MRLFPINPPLPVGEIGDALDTWPDTPEDSTKLEAMRVVMMLVALLGMLAGDGFRCGGADARAVPERYARHGQQRARGTLHAHRARW